MYLVVLLATFMSAIYGYNLSARSDYDRDIPKKKAAALMYRFIFQHGFARRLMRRIENNEHASPLFILPGDIMYADTSGEEMSDYTLVYDQTHPSANDGAGVKFLLRESETDADSKNYMQLGLKLINGEEMASKVLCLNRLMTCTADDSDNDLCKARDGTKGAAEMCEVDVDPYDSTIITGTCCGPYKSRGGIYVVSFMKLDARWKGRIDGSLNYDFWRAIQDRGQSDNIGVINWENGAWQFKGKMYFYPSYAKEYDEWIKTHPDRLDDPFPLHKMRKTSWTLPVGVFTRDFFKVNGVDYCENGCLFHIKSF